MKTSYIALLFVALVFLLFQMRDMFFVTSASKERGLGYLETEMGSIFLFCRINDLGVMSFRFFPDAAPLTVAQFRRAFEENFFGGLDLSFSQFSGR